MSITAPILARMMEELVGKVNGENENSARLNMIRVTWLLALFLRISTSSSASVNPGIDFLVPKNCGEIYC